MILGDRFRTVVLASASPRRKELLLAAGFEVIVAPADIDETPRPGELPQEYVKRLAEEKALRSFAVAEQMRMHPFIGADTTVVVGNLTLGKPASSEEARSMLEQLSGREHRVLTGVCLLARLREAASQPDWRDIACVSTVVTFDTISAPEIESYVASGEPFDKAGGYAIQGLASKFIRSIEGDYCNVVGLPVATVYRMLKRVQQASAR